MGAAKKVKPERRLRRIIAGWDGISVRFAPT